ncbi:hypothetical protein DOY81_010128, partial [Sarcophaga bullata]
PKLSSASLLTNVDNIPHNNFLESSDITYANASNNTSTSLTSSTADNINLEANVYGNILRLNSLSTSTTAIGNIYSNVAYNKNQEQRICAEEQHNASVGKMLFSSKSNADNNMCSASNSLIADDEIQPPPSPVSSSYSELRRATEVFKTILPKKTPTINSFHDQMNVPQTIVGYEMPHDHRLPGAAMDIRQLYINKPLYAANDSFGKYNTVLQAKNNPTFSDYYGYGGFSQTSSTYESIYEPINPRPPSQLSTRSNNLMYPSCSKNSNATTLPECGAILGKSTSSNLSTLSGLSGSSSADSNSPLYPNSSRSSGGDGINNYPQNSKESEEESITDFLVKSISPHQDLENYGICYKCNEIVVGENSGCTAMNQIYHIACFTCSQCQINLQGKPFYALECKPYCEFDYLQTLEKCSVCMKPILERILRATGKPYHPQCFTCVVCKKSLDGIPFTVDATNQNYCIEDFHKKFAPRCCVCKEPIMPDPGEEETVRVVALDRSFHFECYKCEDCGLLLSSEAEGRGCYPLDDHVLCKSCNAKRVQMLTNRMTTTEL